MIQKTANIAETAQIMVNPGVSGVATVVGASVLTTVCTIVSAVIVSIVGFSVRSSVSRVSTSFLIIVLLCVIYIVKSETA